MPRHCYLPTEVHACLVIVQPPSKSGMTLLLKLGGSLLKYLLTWCNNLSLLWSKDEHCLLTSCCANMHTGISASVRNGLQEKAAASSCLCGLTMLLSSADIPPIDAFKWMGVVMIAVAMIGVGGQYFPMWGGMFFPARAGATEEDYYFAEYSAAERERGLHLASSAFVSINHVLS